MLLDMVLDMMLDMMLYMLCPSPVSVCVVEYDGYDGCIVECDGCVLEYDGYVVGYDVVIFTSVQYDCDDVVDEYIIISLLFIFPLLLPFIGGVSDGYIIVSF
eukprot:241420_1